MAFLDEIARGNSEYVALSYGHRLVDCEQAVTFLARVKEQIEDPARMVRSGPSVIRSADALRSRRRSSYHARSRTSRSSISPRRP